MTERREGSWGWGWFRVGIPLLLALAMGAISVDGTFVHDDHVAILLNPVVTGEVPRGEAFQRDFWGNPLDENPSSYRPLVTWGWSWLFTKPASPLPYRVLSLFLFVLCTDLVRRLFARHLGHDRERAMLATCLFALSPIHAEAIGAIVAQADLLSAVLGIGVLLVGAATTKRSLIASLLLAVGCLVKETTIFFGIALLLFELVRGSASPRYRSLVGPALVVGIAVAGHLGIDRGVALGDPRNNMGIGAEGSMRVLWGLFETGRATLLSIIPWPLAPNHGYATAALDVRTLGPQAAFGLAAICSGLLATVWAIRTRNGLLLAALALFFGPIVLQSNLLVRTQTDLAERLLFVPSIPLAAGLGLLFSHRRLAPALRALLVTLVLSLYAVDSWVSLRAWRSDHSLWKRALASEPLSIRSQFNYGIELMNQGRGVEGAWHLLLAHYISLSYPEPVNWEPVEDLEAVPLPIRIVEAPGKLVYDASACELATRAHRDLETYQPLLAEELRPAWSRRYCSQ